MSETKTSKKAEKPEKEIKTIGSVLDSIRKEYGDVHTSAVGLKAREGLIVPVSLSIDIALGGGIPMGTIATLSGVTQSGKSSLALQIIANAQKMGMNAYYNDAENRLHSSLLDCIEDLDKEKLTVLRSSKEKILGAEDHCNIIHSLITEDPGCIVVMDSIAALQAQSAAAVKFGESKRMTAVPTLMYEFLRDMSPRVHATKSILILISHLQANPGGYTGPVEVGGNAQKFFSSVRLLCTSSREVPDETPKLGRESTFKVLKSALGPPGEAEFYIKYGSGYDKLKDLAVVAESLGLIIKSGAWYTIDVTPYNEKKVQGMANVMETIDKDPALYKTLDEKIRGMVFTKKK